MLETGIAKDLTLGGIYSLEITNLDVNKILHRKLKKNFVKGMMDNCVSANEAFDKETVTTRTMLLQVIISIYIFFVQYISHFYKREIFE